MQHRETLAERADGRGRSAQHQVVVAGANDYCAAIVNGDTWAGYYRSTDGGSSWQDSLVPGYPDDSSAAGLASPAHGSCGGSRRPVARRSIATGVCSTPSSASTARSRSTAACSLPATRTTAAAYDRTVLVKRGTPSGLFLTGLFQDKINLTVDQTTGAVLWQRLCGLVAIRRVRPDQRRAVLPFHRPWPDLLPADPGHAGIARHRVVRRSRGRPRRSGVSDVLDLPVLVQPEHGRLALEVDRRRGLLRPGGSRGDDRDVRLEPVQRERRDGLRRRAIRVPERSYLLPVHERACGRGRRERRTRGLERGARQRSVEGLRPQLAGRGQLDDAGHTLDAVPVGHQWTPDIASAGGVINVVFYDSRADPAYSPSLPPGNTEVGTNSGDVVHTFMAKSTNGGTGWSENQLSTAGSNFNWETHGSRRDPFWGDYIYVSAVGGTVIAAWTDSRDMVAGRRSAGDGCRRRRRRVRRLPAVHVRAERHQRSVLSSPLISDPCLSQGGLDQNIYAASP